MLSKKDVDLTNLEGWDLKQYALLQIRTHEPAFTHLRSDHVVLAGRSPLMRDVRVERRWSKAASTEVDLCRAELSEALVLSPIHRIRMPCPTLLHTTLQRIYQAMQARETNVPCEHLRFGESCLCKASQIACRSGISRSFTRRRLDSVAQVSSL